MSNAAMACGTDCRAVAGFSKCTWAATECPRQAASYGASAADSRHLPSACDTRLTMALSNQSTFTLPQVGEGSAQSANGMCGRYAAQEAELEF